MWTLIEKLYSRLIRIHSLNLFFICCYFSCLQWMFKSHASFKSLWLICLVSFHCTLSHLVFIDKPTCSPQQKCISFFFFLFPAFPLRVFRPMWKFSKTVGWKCTYCHFLEFTNVDCYLFLHLPAVWVRCSYLILWEDFWLHKKILTSSTMLSMM